MRLFQAMTMNHTPHILASVFLCGLWLPIWIILALSESHDWRCAFCGFTDHVNYLSRPGLRAEEQRQRLIRAQQSHNANQTESDEFGSSLFSRFSTQQLVAGGITATLLILAFSIVVVSVYRDGAAKDIGKVAAPAQRPVPVYAIISPLSEDDKKYLRTATAYLKSSFDANEEFSFTLERQAQLSEIKRGIERVKRREDALFAVDYGKVKAPANYRQLDQDIRTIHKDLSAAYDDYFSYFASNQSAFIESGSSKFKDALLRLKSSRDALASAIANVESQHTSRDSKIR